MWLALVFMTLSSYIFLCYYNSIRGYFLTRNMNGPPTLPIIGNAHQFLNKTAAEIFETTMTMPNKYGDFFKLWLGPQLKIVITDTNDIEIILSSQRYLEKSSDYELFRSFVYDGLFLSTGKKWHDRRKITAPAFRYQMVEKFTETFDRLGNLYIEKLSEHCAKNDDIEFFYLNKLHALNVVCETAMGVSLNALSQPNSAYLNSINTFQTVFNARLYNLVYRNPWLYKWTKLQKIESKAMEVLHGFIADVIRKRRQELIDIRKESDGHNENASVDELGIRKKRALCDILLNSSIDGKPLSDLDIHEEVNMYISAGYSTTASAMTFWLYTMAKRPEIQQKCFNEVVEVYGPNVNQPATFSLLNQLSYLEMTIKETLRLYPPAPIIARKANEDIILTNNRIVPRGADIIIPFYSVFRNPKYFDDAEQFKPERFSIEQSVEEKNFYSYIPFSAGPRNCPGQKFSLFEMKSILSKIVHNFEISLTKEFIDVPLNLCSQLILIPERHMKFNLKRRA